MSFYMLPVFNAVKEEWLVQEEDGSLRTLNKVEYDYWASNNQKFDFITRYNIKDKLT